MWEKLYCQEIEYIKKSNEAKKELYRTLKWIQTHNDWWQFEFLELLKNSFNHFISHFFRHISKHAEIGFIFLSFSLPLLTFPSSFLLTYPSVPPVLPFFLPSFPPSILSFILPSFYFYQQRGEKHDSFDKYYSKGKMLLIQIVPCSH